MAKKSTVKNVKTSMKSSFDFSKFYFSKPTSVVLVTSYATILLLVLGTLGFSKIINPKNIEEQGIPSLPDSEPFAFLPADNIEVPELGDVEEEPAKTAEQEPKAQLPEIPAVEPQETTEIVSNYTPVYTTPVVVEKEVVKEVVKTIEVPKEVVKEVVKEVPVETKKEPESSPEQTYFENYSAPDAIPYEPTVYENFPDIEEDTEEVSNDAETTPEQ